MVEASIERRSAYSAISENYQISRLKALDRGEPISDVDFKLYEHALIEFSGINRADAIIKTNNLRDCYVSNLKDTDKRHAIEYSIIGACTDLLKVQPGLQSLTEISKLESSF